MFQIDIEVAAAVIFVLYARAEMLTIKHNADRLANAYAKREVDKYTLLINNENMGELEENIYGYVLRVHPLLSHKLGKTIITGKRMIDIVNQLIN